MVFTLILDDVDDAPSDDALTITMIPRTLAVSPISLLSLAVPPISVLSCGRGARRFTELIYLDEFSCLAFADYGFISGAPCGHFASNLALVPGTRWDSPMPLSDIMNQEYSHSNEEDPVDSTDDDTDDTETTLASTNATHESMPGME
jgi:hypothetical protein